LVVRKGKYLDHGCPNVVLLTAIPVITGCFAGRTWTSSSTPNCVD